MRQFFTIKFITFFKLSLVLVHYFGFSLVLAQPVSIPAVPNTPLKTPPATPIPVPVENKDKDKDKTKPVEPVKKVYEYQSICIHENKPIKTFSTELQNKRTSLLEKKLSEEKDTNKKSTIIKKLIKEFLSYKNLIKAETIFKNESVHLTKSDLIISQTKISIFKKLLSESKKNLSNYLLENTKDKNALELLIEVLELQSNYSEAINTLEDLQKFNKKTDYIEKFCHLTTLDADHSRSSQYCQELSNNAALKHKAFIYLGISSRDQEKYKEAINYFKKSLELKITEFAQTCLAESLNLNKQIDLSAENYQIATELDSTSERAFIGLAQTKLIQLKYDESLSAFEKACDLGLKGKIEMLKAAAGLKEQKIKTADLFFQSAQKCKKIF